MSYKERKTIYVNDLLDFWVGEVEGLTDLRIINVLDTAGNVVARADKLEVIYELEFEEED